MRDLMNRYTIYDVDVRIITPVHFGTGRSLLQDYDYVVHGGKTWRLDETAILEEAWSEDPAQARILARTPPGQLLDAKDYVAGSKLFRYVIPGAPRSTSEGSQLQEQMKDVHDRPYIPGSELKGALRTALAWYGWGERGLKPERYMLGRSRKWAGQRYERKIFGDNPNHDLLKALHVGDSAPPEDGGLMVVNVQVLTPGGTGSPIELEAIKPGVTFRLQVKLDEALFSEWAGRHRLDIDGLKWLQSLPGVVKAHTEEMLEKETEWYSSAGAKRCLEFVKKIRGARIASNSFLTQVGWGTGWHTKTFDGRLEEDQAFLEGIISDYRLARGKRQYGDPFPKSRRVVMVDGGKTPAVPMGWVQVTMKER